VKARIQPEILPFSISSAIAMSSSVIVHDPHLMWLTVKPFEDDSPLIINPDGVEIPEITTSISPVDSMAAP